MAIGNGVLKDGINMMLYIVKMFLLKMSTQSLKYIQYVLFNLKTDDLFIQNAVEC